MFNCLLGTSMHSDTIAKTEILIFVAYVSKLSFCNESQSVFSESESEWFTGDTTN